MRALYQFPKSAFARRVRLALAHKGLEADFLDANADEAVLEAGRRLSPLATMPVLDDGGRAIGDSTAMTFYLDLAYPELPALWPRGADAAHRATTVVTLVDFTLDTLVDLGTRYWALCGDPAWDALTRDRVGRAQRAIDAVAALARGPYLAGDGWSVADIWALTAARWVSTMPERAPSSTLIAQILTLGLRMPEPLVVWAAQHEAREDVRAVYA